MRILAEIKAMSIIKIVLAEAFQMPYVARR